VSVEASSRLRTENSHRSIRDKTLRFGHLSRVLISRKFHMQSIIDRTSVARDVHRPEIRWMLKHFEGKKVMRETLLNRSSCVFREFECQSRSEDSIYGWDIPGCYSDVHRMSMICMICMIGEQYITNEGIIIGNRLCGGCVGESGIESSRCRVGRMFSLARFMATVRITSSYRGWFAPRVMPMTFRWWPVRVDMSCISIDVWLLSMSRARDRLIGTCWSA